MDFNGNIIAVLAFPFSIFVLGMAFAAFQRYLKHKERMAMIASGMAPDDWKEEGMGEHAKMRSVTTGLVVTLVGVAITLGLLTIGIGPWLIGGLVPTAIGCAMLVGEMFKDRQEDKKGQ